MLQKRYVVIGSILVAILLLVGGFGFINSQAMAQDAETDIQDFPEWAPTLLIELVDVTPPPYRVGDTITYTMQIKDSPYNPWTPWFQGRYNATVFEDEVSEASVDFLREGKRENWETFQLVYTPDNPGWKTLKTHFAGQYWCGVNGSEGSTDHLYCTPYSQSDNLSHVSFNVLGENGLPELSSYIPIILDKVQ